MDSFGLLSCNGKQVFTNKVVIGKGHDFRIGQIWADSFSLDTNFQMITYLELNGTEALDEFSSGTTTTTT
jgi:hypothetical protein